MQRIYRERVKLVARLLEARPVCERCCVAASVDVHEVKSRARGGSILDEANCRCLCRSCHDHVTTHPAESYAAGWLIHSWETL